MKKWKANAFLLTMVGCMQSLIFTSIALFFYSGGSNSNPLNPGFVIFQNSISDLGMSISFSGKLNVLSASIYNNSTFVLGGLMIPYFLTMPHLFKAKSEEKIYCVIASLIGIVLAIAIIGSSLTPPDLFFDLHLTFSYVIFGATLPMWIFYATSLLMNKDYPQRYAVIYLAMIILMGAFFAVIVLTVNPEGYVYYFPGEELIMYYIFLPCQFIQAYGAWRLVKNNSKSRIEMS